MTRLLPGVKAKMGRWNYYMVRMTMEEVSRVKFATEIEEGNALDDALQRTLNESRSKSQIATYLQRQPDRFFNSIVIATLGGEPRWFPINVEDDPQLALVADDANIVDSFGILRFNGNEDYFALDGQHRLAAIRELLNPQSDLYKDAPDGFAHEQQSVVLVVPDEAETTQQFKERFRRLFGNLNRYAKSMDLATSIIMDEDDAIAIVTRRLFSQHDFFKTVGAERDSRVVDMHKGANITNPRAPYLTKLEILYKMNTTLLSARARELNGWCDSNEKLVEFIRFRPDDEVLDALYEELATYWDALLDVLPVLRSEASKMRNHAVATAEDPGDEQDNLIFWPLGQRLIASVARTLLDSAEAAPGSFAQAKQALAPLAKVPLALDKAPWRNFLLVPGANETYRMRSEDGARVARLAESLIVFILQSEGEPDSVELLEIKARWAEYLLPAFSEEQVNDHWKSGMQFFGIRV